MQIGSRSADGSSDGRRSHDEQRRRPLVAHGRVRIGDGRGVRDGQRKRRTLQKLISSNPNPWL